MTDLSNLPPEVREAIEQFDCVTMHGAKWRLLRDYILRVTAERDALAKDAQQRMMGAGGAGVSILNRAGEG